MEGKLVLTKNIHNVYNYTLDEDILGNHGYIITINVDLDQNFEDIISNTETLDTAIDFEIEFLETDDLEFSKENLKFYQSCKNKSKELLQNAKYIEFKFSIDEISEYVKKNPILKTKKIILTDEYELNTDILKMIKDKFENTDNLCFQLSNNTNLISFNECYNTYLKLETIAKFIKKLNLSPIEQIMYVYDIVRDRVYVQENKNDTYEISRDLSSALLGDKIVCLGYTRIFSSILEQLGISSRQCFLYNDQKGHARNEIYIKDEKYNIDGIYYFDTTWDSKKKKDDTAYLLSYKYFAKPKSYFDEIDQKRIKIVDKEFPYYSADIDKELKTLLEAKKIYMIPKDIIKSINHMSRIVTGESLIPSETLIPFTPMFGKINTEETIKKLSQIKSYFNKPLSADTLLKILYNVRKYQYYLEPEKYQFSLNDFYKITILSEWEFEPTENEILLSTILDKKVRTPKNEQIAIYAKESGLYKDIQNIRITKILRRTLETK